MTTCEWYAGGRIEGTDRAKWAGRKRGGMWYLFRPYDQLPVNTFGTFEDMRTWKDDGRP